MVVAKWVTYTAVNSLLCIFGGICVPLISFLFQSKGNVNSKLVNYGLSLSAGSMLTTSLYKMLPHMDEVNNWRVFTGLLMGICMSLSINYIVHSFTSESLLHCAHSSDDGSHEDHESTGRSSDQDAHSDTPDERSRLLEHSHKNSTIKAAFQRPGLHRSNTYCSSSCVPIGKSKSISCMSEPVIDASANGQVGDTHKCLNNCQRHLHNGHGVTCLENEVGYDLENLSLYREHFLSGRFSGNSDSTTAGLLSRRDGSHNHNSNDAESHSLDVHLNHEEDHHHVLETPFSKLVSIGLQTCVVLTLHKFPEGFIVYYTNRSKDTSQLGLSIFISLAIHNFVEGFAMTLPFYAALDSKITPILITAVLGGGSQPLGALLGYYFFKSQPTDGGQPDQGSTLQMDLFLSLTAGFLLVIALQMFQTGVGFSDGHHHHDNEETQRLKENHSLGTTCLKWCCGGVLLILASGLFV